MANAQLRANYDAENSRLSEFSFGLPAADNRPAYTPAARETRRRAAAQQRGKSTPTEILLALLILGAAVVSTFGINQQMVARQFPQLAAALHLKVPAEAPALPTGDNAHVKVWADLSTALYYCPGSPSYGRTKNGRYLSQAEARLANFEPALRNDCSAGPAALLRKPAVAHR